LIVKKMDDTHSLSLLLVKSKTTKVLIWC